MGDISDYYRDIGEEYMQEYGQYLYEDDDFILHKCKNGKKVCVNSSVHPRYTVMTNDHLLNTIKYIERKAKEGVEVVSEPPPADVDMMVEPHTIYRDEVLIKMDYQVYVDEAKKRKLL